MTTPANRHSIIGASYCPSGLGKTVDMLYSFPRGLFLGREEAFTGADFVGYRPVVVPVRGLRQAKAIVEQLVAQGRAREFDAIIVDDTTIMVDETVADMESGANGYRKATGWALWGGVIDELLSFLDLARKHGLIVWFNGHEAPPTVKQGMALRGSMQLPGKLPEKFPALVDTFVRIRAAPHRKGRGWPVEVWCGGPMDPSYLTKDRYAVIPEVAPLNTAEFIRASSAVSGAVLRRAAGLEWMDGAVHSLAERMYDVTEPLVQQGRGGLEIELAEKEVVKSFDEMIAKRGITDRRHIQWIKRDAYDRIDLRRARRLMFNLYA